MYTHPTHPSTLAFQHGSLYVQKHLGIVTTKSTLEPKNLLSENTLTGHWETLVDCMENIEKR